MDISTTTLHVNSILKVSLDIISGGSNSWIFHSSDDGRKSLHIALRNTSNTDGKCKFCFIHYKRIRI